ncbi:MAG TPA: EAL domain-containing protein [Blastocatellia bacterium]|nr:EAL domain-containing protein [Blastocatellia bacterium]
MRAPVPGNETARLQAVRRYRTSDTGVRELLDNFTRMAAQVCAAPFALLTFIDGDRLIHEACVGIRPSDTARERSIFAWAILEPRLFVVRNAAEDVRLCKNPLVTGESAIRFFAAAPLLSPEGYALGTLSVMDRRARDLSPGQASSLRSLASAVIAQLELRQKEQEIERIEVERQHALDALSEIEERYALAVRNTSEGLWDWDLQTNEITFCPRWKTMLGYTSSEIGTRLGEWFSRVHPEEIESLQTEVMAHLLGHTPEFYCEHRLQARDGSYRWVLGRGVAQWDADSNLYRMSGSITDITSHKETESRLLRDTFHDVLTGLPNRALFLERVARASDAAGRGQGHLFAVLYLDLDRFKDINDSFGHHMGDQLLVAVARMLEKSLRPGDVLAKFGGDEFAIFLDHLKHVGDATEAAERIQKQFLSPFSLNGQEVFASASIGIALNLAAENKPEEILRNADITMYRAKERGRGRFELFDKDIKERNASRFQMESDLRHALAREEFRVHYQPIISLDTWRIRGFEALLRWEHPQHGFISPMKFIPAAEETGAIVPIGLWVLGEACRQLRAWQELFPYDPPLTVSVNLSGRQFSQPGLVEAINHILIKTGLEPRSLKVEITESAIIENLESATATLKQLKMLGIQISLDDFGTGYSSLSYLHRFPIDTLKIDRSFVTRMNLPKNTEIIRTIVDLANNLGMDVIAEGVETREQIIQLTGMKCEYVQGYLLSKPRDGEAMRELIEETYKRGLGQHAGAA